MTPKIIIFAALLSAGTAIAVVKADPIKTFDTRYRTQNCFGMNKPPWVQSQVPRPEPQKKADYSTREVKSGFVQDLAPKPEPATKAIYADPCFRTPPPIVQSPDCLAKFEKKWGRKAASSEVDIIEVPAPKLISSGEEDQPDYFTRRVRVMDQFWGSKQNY